ncbi:hypothetical protein D3C80_2122520 [compost metagenome]
MGFTSRFRYTITPETVTDQLYALLHTNMMSRRNKYRLAVALGTQHYAYLLSLVPEAALRQRFISRLFKGAGKPAFTTA